VAQQTIERRLAAVLARRGDQVRRREFIALFGAIAAPLALSSARAQEAGRTYRIATLGPIPRGNPIIVVLLDELRRNGFVEGRNLAADARGFAVAPTELDPVATELVKEGPDAIVTFGPEAGHAAQRATGTLPIIAASDDLVGSGLVASMSNPGGNTTGVGIFASQLDAKRLEILHEIVPQAHRIGVLADPATTSSRPQLEAAARELGIELILFDARSKDDIVRAIDAMSAAQVDGINVLASPIFGAASALIVDRIHQHRLPSIHQWPETAREGGLVAYGPRLDAFARLVAGQLVRVLRGARPRDLPVEQPTKFELVINLERARALGFSVPQAVVLRADEVIE
jgi:ABC-type uncharacterized transport system substrate-binding protein